MRITDLNEAVGYIHWEDEEFDPSDPTIGISGYGTIKLSSFRNMISRDLANMKDEVDSGNMAFVLDLTNRNSAFMHKLNAYNDALSQLNDPQIKRKITLLKKSR